MSKLTSNRFIRIRTLVGHQSSQDPYYAVRLIARAVSIYFRFLCVTQIWATCSPSAIARVLS